MTAVKISLNSIDKVKSFCNDIAKFDAEFDLVSGRYVIDAKSIMGIFSLDISKPIELNIHAESGIDEIMATLKPYLAIVFILPRMLYGSDNQRDAYYEASLFCCLLSLFYIVLLLCATHNDLCRIYSLAVQWLDDSCELCLRLLYRRENRMCNRMLCNKCRTAILVWQYRCLVCSDLL